MNLRKFIAASRVLGSIPDRSRYQVPRESELPAFGSGRPLKISAGESPLETSRRDVFSPSSPARPRRNARKSKWRSLISAINPFKIFARRPRSGRDLVQTELLLSSVQPVRNDLSDADLEVVALERKNKAARAQSMFGFTEASAARQPVADERRAENRLRQKLAGDEKGPQGLLLDK